MAKQDSKKNTLGRVGRVEREQRYTNIIIYSTAAVVGAIVLILIFGGVLEGLVRPNQPIVTVNGEELLTKDYQARVRYQRSTLVSSYYQYYQFYLMGQQYQDQTTMAQALNQLRTLQIQLDPFTTGKSVLDQMVDEIIIRQAAQELGIDIPEEQLEIAIQEAFGYFEDGRPTFTMAPTTAATSTLDPTQLAIITQAPTFTSTPDLTLAPESPSEDQAEPTEEDVAEATATSLFPTPTNTAIPTITLTPTPYTYELFETTFDQITSDYQDQIGFGEDNLRTMLLSELYREAVMEAVTADLPREQDQVWARHILLEDEATALEVLELYENGEDFGELALAYSLDTSNAERGGDLGWFSSTNMVADFSRAAFNTPVGQVSEPIQTSFGWHLIQVLGHELRPLSAFDYEQYRAETFSIWLEQQRVTAEIEFAENWESRIPDDPSVPPQLLQ